MEGVGALFKSRDLEDMCIAAARRADKWRQDKDVSFIDAFRGQLVMLAWSAEHVEVVVRRTKVLIRRGIRPWELPLTAPRSAEWLENPFLTS